MRNNRLRILLTFGLVFLLIFSSSAAAFQDLSDGAESTKILSLKERGLISGIDGKHFAPDQELNYAQGIALIVSGLNLTQKAEQSDVASDVFNNVPASAWYHDVFTIAVHHDLELEADVDPSETMTREHYTHLLFEAMLSKLGDHAFIEPYILIADEADVNAEYMNSIQKMLITNITSLDDQSYFYPKKAVTRAEAAVMLHDTLEYIAKQQETRPPVDNPDEPVSSEEPPFDTIPELPEPPKYICDDQYFKSNPVLEMNEDGVATEPAVEDQDESAVPCEMYDDVAVSISPVTDDINKVRLSWGEKPNSGYGISIDKIEFSGTKAIVYYSKHYPDPDMMYLQVITYPEASTYVDSKYEIELKDQTKGEMIKPIDPIKPVEPIEKQLEGEAPAIR